MKARALRYLSTREHSRAELAAKLARHAGEEDGQQKIERVLDELSSKGFIDEARVAESVLHRRAPRLGAARVLHELRAKVLPEAVIAAAADRLRATERERAHAVWLKKFGKPPQNVAEFARQLRFLTARGFSGDIARRTIAGGLGEPL